MRPQETAIDQRTSTPVKIITLLVVLIAASALLGFSPSQGFALANGSADLAAAQASDSNSKLATCAKAKKLPSYTVTPKTKPLNTAILKSDTYTAQTKHWWMLSNIMEKFEKAGGGTLTLKKGTYQLPVSVQIPSNVTIILKKGAVVKKITKTGSKRISPNAPLFQMVPPSKKKIVGSVSNYNGTKNVTLIGEGNASFDMAKTKGCTIIMAQNQNIHVSGITFKNLASHAFELDASKHVVIEKCKFMNGIGHKTSEAINLDIPDPKTRGFNHTWSKMDKTPDQDITIQNCTFSNVMRAIGSHSYVQANDGTNVMPSDIKILNNKFTGISGYEGCVVTFNWKNVTIQGNTFVGKGKAVKTYGIVAHSVQNAWISNNTFSNFQHTILVRRGFTNKYYDAPAEVFMDEEQKELLSTNKYVANTVSVPSAQVTERQSYTYDGDEWFDLEKIQ